MNCCNKGKCSPSNSDNCCKATVPGGNQLVIAQAADYSVPVLAVLATEVACNQLQFLATSNFFEIYQPPGSPPDFRRNLPLLI